MAEAMAMEGFDGGIGECEKSLSLLFDDVSSLGCSTSIRLSVHGWLHRGCLETKKKPRMVASHRERDS